jgi:hypothetical protein
VADIIKAENIATPLSENSELRITILLKNEKSFFDPGEMLNLLMPKNGHSLLIYYLRWLWN